MVEMICFIGGCVEVVQNGMGSVGMLPDDRVSSLGVDANMGMSVAGAKLREGRWKED